MPVLLTTALSARFVAFAEGARLAAAIFLFGRI